MYRYGSSDSKNAKEDQQGIDYGKRRAKIRSLEFKEPYLRALVNVVDDVDQVMKKQVGKQSRLTKRRCFEDFEIFLKNIC